MVEAIAQAKKMPSSMAAPTVAMFSEDAEKLSSTEARSLTPEFKAFLVNIEPAAEEPVA